jgi:hypothetical protein
MIPRAFPARFQQQTPSFTRKPATSFGNTRGLKEPVYTVIPTTSDYEIRDYVVTRSRRPTWPRVLTIFTVLTSVKPDKFSIVGVVRVWRQRGQEAMDYDDAGANDHEWRNALYLDQVDILIQSSDDEGDNMYESAQ